MSKAVVARPEGAVAKNGAPRGLEGFDKKDLMLPKALLMQGLSKLVTREGKEVGTFVHSITKETLGKSFEFIPVSATKYFELLKQEGNKMVLDTRVYDENDPRLKGRRFFPEKGLKPNATSVISYICLVNDEPLILSFSKTSYKAGKKLGTMAMMSGKDLFATKYRVTAKQETRGENDYMVMDVEEVGAATSDEYAAAEKLYESFGKRITEVYNRVAEEDGDSDSSNHSDVHDVASVDDVVGDAQEPVDDQGTFEEAEPAKSEFTKPRVLMKVSTNEDKACKKCGEPRVVKEGKVKTNDPETGLPWGKVKALVCGKCNLLDVIEKLPD